MLLTSSTRPRYAMAERAFLGTFLFDFEARNATLSRV